MKRINVTFYDEIYEKLVIRSEKNGSKSLGHDIRELVDLGLKVEEASLKNSCETVDDLTPRLVEMLKKNLTWMLETRLLARFLVEQLPDPKDENQSVILEKYKEKAISYVEGMLNADPQ